MGWRRGGGADGVARRWVLLLCVGSFCLGLLFTDRMWSLPEADEVAVLPNLRREEEAERKTGDCNVGKVQGKHDYNDMLRVSDAHHNSQTLDKAIANLETELSAARTLQDSFLNGSPVQEDYKASESTGRRKYLMVIGINTAFSSRKRRDSIRNTWMPTGEIRKKLEEERGIIVFVIGHSAISGGIVDRAIQAEDKKHGDFMRLDHVEGYLELSGKTRTYFATAVALWDANFYVKVDDDVHVNIATLGNILSKHISKPRVYIGCMKSGPVLSDKDVRYYEPEHWKFGEVGNKYFRHATGQLYAISKDLAAYISLNKHVLHKYINEDVSLGAWLIGLDVEHIDDRRLCCGTPPDCEWKAQAGNTCAASFDWKMQRYLQLCAEHLGGS
uniref:Hexosyltransferase n=1 Tax=Zea mays TaxID=4577 RepID=B6TZ56_MAIZE|nr:beta-1,3-galactosyltransferase sqv-2 [Zea mays]